MKSVPHTVPDANAAETNRRVATLDAVKTLLQAADYDTQAIARALTALNGAENDPLTPDQLLTAREVCTWLGISLSTVWRWKIPHVRVCGLRRFYRRDVEMFLSSRYVRNRELT
jgi:excisionase family DNA binding protein